MRQPEARRCIYTVTGETMELVEVGEDPEGPYLDARTASGELRRFRGVQLRSFVVTS